MMTESQRYRGVWRTMLWRCSSPKCSQSKDYLGRGITVCDRWKNFELFLTDMGPRPFPGASLDRINGYGNYEPGNVRWATASMQSRNTRRCVMLTAFGDTKSIQEWSEDPRCKCSYHALYQRTQRHGWTDTEQAISTPPYDIKHPTGYANAKI